MLSINGCTDGSVLLMAHQGHQPGTGPCVQRIGYDMTWIDASGPPADPRRPRPPSTTSLSPFGLDLEQRPERDRPRRTAGFGADGDDRDALSSRGLFRVKIAVTEINAAIWDEVCTRGQFTIEQGLWLADAWGFRS